MFVQRELSPATRAFFDARLLALMQPAAVLVNTARKDLLDQRAVAGAVREQRIGGLALDARLAPGDPLTELLHDPRVLITPHVGWYSERALEQLRRQTVADTIAAHPSRRNEQVRAGESR